MYAQPQVNTMAFSVGFFGSVVQAGNAVDRAFVALGYCAGRHGRSPGDLAHVRDAVLETAGGLSNSQSLPPLWLRPPRHTRPLPRMRPGRPG